jgi:hypothetical protein
MIISVKNKNKVSIYMKKYNHHNSFWIKKIAQPPKNSILNAKKIK